MLKFILLLCLTTFILAVTADENPDAKTDDSLKTIEELGKLRVKELKKMLKGEKSHGCTYFGPEPRLVC